MMRVVLDTNVLVGGLIRPNGRLGPILRRLRDGDYTILYAASSLEELVSVLMRPRIRDKYGVTDGDIEAVLALILVRGEVVSVERRIAACRDPKDDLFLEIGVAGHADAIVSGDRDLLVLHPFEGIPVITPAELLQCLDQADE